jgi:hypothetical protein
MVGVFLAMSPSPVLDRVHDSSLGYPCMHDAYRFVVVAAHLANEAITMSMSPIHYGLSLFC